MQDVATSDVLPSDALRVLSVPRGNGWRCARSLFRSSSRKQDSKLDTAKRLFPLVRRQDSKLNAAKRLDAVSRARTVHLPKSSDHTHDGRLD
jgi:hypothetical protein